MKFIKILIPEFCKNILWNMYGFYQRSYHSSNLLLLERDMEQLKAKFAGRFKGEEAVYHESVDRIAFQKYFPSHIEFIEQACAAGAYCFAMKYEGDVVGYFCAIAGDSYYQPDINYTFSLKKGQIYQFSAFLHPNFRRSSIAHDGQAYVWNFFMQKGYKTVLCYVDESNVASLKLHGRFEFLETGQQLVCRHWFRWVRTKRESYQGQKFARYRRKAK